MRMRELKPSAADLPTDGETSHPMRMRELKHDTLRRIASQKHSHDRACVLDPQSCPIVFFWKNCNQLLLILLRKLESYSFYLTASMR